MCVVDVLSLGTLTTVTVVGVFAGLTVCAVDVLSLGTLNTAAVVGVCEACLCVPLMYCLWVH